MNFSPKMFLSAQKGGADRPLMATHGQCLLFLDGRCPTVACFFLTGSVVGFLAVSSLHSR